MSRFGAKLLVTDALAPGFWDVVIVAANRVLEAGPEKGQANEYKVGNVVFEALAATLSRSWVVLRECVCNCGFGVTTNKPTFSKTDFLLFHKEDRVVVIVELKRVWKSRLHGSDNF